MKLRKLFRTVDFLIINLRIVPLEIIKVAATCLQDWIVESITAAILIRILTINHPSAARRKASSLLWLSFIAGVALGELSDVESRSSDIKMSLVA